MLFLAAIYSIGPWQHNRLQALCIRRVEIRVSLLQEMLYPLIVNINYGPLVVHSVGVSEYGNYTTQARESPSVRHFSFWEGSGLVTSMLLC